MKKRILATVLAAVMALSLLPMSALAAPRYEEEVVAETPMGEEVQESAQREESAAPAAPAEIEEPPAAAELLAEGEDLPEAPTVSGDTITVTPANAQYTLDGAYGSIDGKTIVFTGEYAGILYVNRPSKYPGSGTVYYNGYGNRTQVDSASDLKQTGVTSYTRDLNNVTLTAAAGVVIPGIQVYGCGHHHDSSNTGTAMDPVREILLQSTNTSFYFNYKLDGLTFDGLTIQNQVEFPMWDDSAQEDGAGKNITFRNCTFLGDVGQMSSLQAVKVVATKQNYNNLTVEDCTFTNYFQGVYTGNVSTGTFKDNSFTNLKHNAIALQNGANMTVDGEIEISGNTFTNVSDRCIRFGDIGADTEITVSENTAINSGDDAGEIMKATTVAPTTSITIAENNDWGEGKKVNEGMLPAAEVNGESYLTLQGAIDAADGKTVKLVKDIYLEQTVNVEAGKTTTLDLNGCKITVKKTSGASLYAIDNYGTLTIDDTSEGKNGKIIARGTGNYGTMYMKGGAIESCDSNGGGAAVWNEGTFEMTGGKLAFTGQKSGNSAGAPFVNAKATATAHITGGELVSPLSCMFVNTGKVTVENISVENSTSYWLAFKVSTGGELTLKNVTVNSKDGGCVEAAGGTVNLEGCTFNQSPKTDVAGEGHTSSTVAVSGGGTVNVKSGNYTSAGFGAYVYNSGGTINIEDGTFTAAEAALKADDSQYVNSPSAIKVEGGSFTGACSIGSESTLAVSGGTFDRDVSDYCAPGLVATAGDDGKYTIGLDPNPEKPLVAQVVGGGAYATLAEAIDAATSGQTVKLLTDIQAQLPNNFGYAYEAAISIEKDLVLEGSNHKITIDTANWQKFNDKPTGYVFNVGVQDGHKNAVESTTVNVTIKDLTIEGNAEYVRAGINAYAMRTPTEDTGVTNLTLENVDITGFGTFSLGVNNSTVSVKDCDLANGGWQQAISVDKGTTNLTVESGIIGNIAFGGSGTKNNASITGGTIAGVFVEEGSNDKQNIAISGGTFGTDVSAYCAEGYQATENNGTWSVAVIPAPDPTPSVTYYTLTVNYVDGEGNEVAPSYTARLSRSSRYNVASPEVEGMVPDQETVSGVMGREDLTVTVTYAANEQLVDPDVPLASGVFIDVAANDWFAAAVSSVYTKELMVGVTANTFAPKALTTRSMVATILHRMESEPTAAAADFSDVLDGAWYAPAVNWANETGLMIGAGNGAFGAEDHITREQLALTFYRYAQFKGQDVTTSGDLSAFADGDDTSDWAKEAMTWAVESGLFQGKGQNILDPKADLTRAELAAILDRFFAEEK